MAAEGVEVTLRRTRLDSPSCLACKDVATVAIRERCAKMNNEWGTSPTFGGGKGHSSNYRATCEESGAHTVTGWGGKGYSLGPGPVTRTFPLENSNAQLGRAGPPAGGCLGTAPGQYLPGTDQNREIVHPHVEGGGYGDWGGFGGCDGFGGGKGEYDNTWPTYGGSGVSLVSPLHTSQPWDPPESGPFKGHRSVTYYHTQTIP